MESLRQYVVSVVAAALICGIVSGMCQNSNAKELIRFLCGLFLLFTVIRPVSGFDFSAITDFSVPFAREAASTAASGENMAQETMADIIKEKSEAYILDKAAEMNVQMSIEIALDANNLPIAAEVCGEVSPYIHQRLENILEKDLGITKENQLWTG